MQKLNLSKLIYLVLIISTFLLSSCATSKKLRYFQDLPDSTALNNIKLPAYHTPLIHAEDILSIIIQTADINVTAPVNVISGSSVGGNSLNGTSSPTGFRVDSTGYVDIPMLGKLNVLNLTLTQARDLIEERAKVFFVDPVVVVKYLSFKVTVVGEVNRPGIIYIQTPKTNIIELITLAGDLTPYGKRNNVLLLRKNEDNTLSTIRLDLTSAQLIRSPYYYLQSNDMVYIEPNNARAVASDVSFNRYLTIGTLALSVFTTILYLFR